MVSQTHEQALEASIEKALSGISREALKDQVGSGYTWVGRVSDSVTRQSTGCGSVVGLRCANPTCRWSSDFDREFAIDKIRDMRA